MTARTLALIVFDSTEAAWLIPMASSVAFSLDAHLTVLHPFRPIVFASGYMAEPSYYASIRAWEEEEAEKIRELVREQTRANGLQYEYRPQKDLYGAESYLLSSARGADLILLGSNRAPGRSPDDRGLAERLIRAAGRPVLVLDEASRPALPAERIVIGWSDTREATRAAHDALTLAAPGAAIELVTVLAHAYEDRPGLDAREDLAAAFDRLGFQVTVTDRSGVAGDRAAELVRAAREGGAGLLATGAFGHSRLYDFAIGAVTRDLLETAEIPLLVSH
ncbi:universal stress protein [Jannaschia formosa]|uniref:universal stress protein n=1 Tax=Jannaschia formosa TaxID=2259592 RepID=UPI000E1B8AD2|nr:universal stress protein [Jannaschia formosa]TFL16389.1 universal stress protein [Jannaschia formosa]